MSNPMDKILRLVKAGTARPDADHAASGWFARMKSDARTDSDEAALRRWLAQDPLHELAYRDIEATWEQLGRHGNTGAIAAMRQRAVDDARIAERDRLFARSRRHALAAGVSVFALAGLLLAAVSFSESTYRTAVGGLRKIELADGSHMTLNTDSLVRVRYTPWERHVTLERGQANFKVAHGIWGPLRPFKVEANNGIVRAIGTEFDVYRRDDEVRVTLIEGRIEVTGLDIATNPGAEGQQRKQLVTGQLVAISRAGLSAVEPVDLPKARSWLDGTLQFDNERLQDAVSEINRYSATKLVVLDRDLAELRIAGVFRTGRVESFLRALEATFRIHAVQAADGTLILTPGASER